MTSIYFDHAATTPVDTQVLTDMWDVYTKTFGNPSSLHQFGRQARQQLEQARRRMAASLGCAASNIVWTSGGTESDHLAVIGGARAQGTGHVLCSSIEHPAVAAAFSRLQSEGFDVEQLPVDSDGRVHVEDVANRVREDTVLVSMMAVNNETGTLQPFKDIGRLVQGRGIIFHVDAVQAVHVLTEPLDQYPVDLMSFSAHKINGPKGIGWLYVADGVQLQALQTGGAQESQRRAGTENVAGAVGAATALASAVEHRQQRVSQMNEVRQRLLTQLQRHLPPASWYINSPLHDAAPHIVNLSFPWTDTQTLLMHLDLEGIAASGGAACSSGSLKPSTVLTAMNKSAECIRSAVRFSFAHSNTREEADLAVAAIKRLYDRIID